MAKQVCWGILGAGAIANAFADGVMRSETGKLVAVGSRTQEKADAFAEKWGGMRAHGNYEALLADPGIGFGKNLEHNLALLSNLETFNSLEVPLALGLSRKRLIGELTGAAVDDRLAGSLTGLVWAIWQGVALLRVHDVRESVAARRMATALAGGGRQVVV